IGRAVHPTLAAGQIEGGTLQAVGYGLLEELVWDKGRIVNNRLTNYIIPTALDAPEMETIIIENPYPHGPFGAKGVGNCRWMERLRRSPQRCSTPRAPSFRRYL